MEPSLLAIRYTAAELLAFTISKFFPDTQLLSGGADEFGFHYDFVVNFPDDPFFITKIEEAMRGLVKEEFSLTKREMMRENAAELFSYRNQPLKGDLVAAQPYNIVQLIEFADFLDIAPPEYSEPSDVVAFRIFDVENISYYTPQHGHFPAIRISGIAFHDKQQLKKFTKQLKIETESDHRVLAQAMELFLCDDTISKFSGAWLPKGCTMRETLLSWRRNEINKMGVLSVITPQLLKEDYFKKCGTFPTQNFNAEIRCDDSAYLASQTASETHAALFASKTRYETELPIRFSEVKEIYNEQVIKTRLFGLLKTPSQLIDFIHSFCSQEQIYEELISWLQFIDKMVTIMSFRCEWYLFTQEDKPVGTKRQWDQTLDLMRKALDVCGLPFIEESNETARVGPKIEGKFLDLLGRSWSGPELAIDFQIPSRLGLKYSKGHDQKIQPSMLRSTIFGPLERLIALLIEKNAGILPLWLAPEQVRIIAVSQNQHLYAKELLAVMQQEGIKATCDLRSGPGAGALGSRIHEVECAKVPYAFVIGDNEEREKVVNVRKCGQKVTLMRMKLEVFIQQLHGDPTFLGPMINKSTIVHAEVYR